MCTFIVNIIQTVPETLQKKQDWKWWIQRHGTKRSSLFKYHTVSQYTWTWYVL